MSPTSVDLWCAEHLARLLGKHPQIDLAIQSLIAHNVLGGFWFALSFFILWVWPSRTTEAAEQENTRKLFFVLLGSLVAIALALLLAALVSWLPPNRRPGLAQLYPAYLDSNPADNSFPSFSVALYGSIAAGIASLRKRLGTALWIAVALFVALPRMYVGGHYLTDVFVGLFAGLLGFAAAHFVEKRSSNVSWFSPAPTQAVRLVANIVVFAWILQVAVEFRDAEWLVRGLRTLFGRFT